MVSICDTPNFDFLGIKFDSKLVFEDHVCGIVSHISQQIVFLRLVKCAFVDSCVTSLLLCNCSPNLLILFSGVSQYHVIEKLLMKLWGDASQKSSRNQTSLPIYQGQTPLAQHKHQ